MWFFALRSVVRRQSAFFCSILSRLHFFLPSLRHAILKTYYSLDAAVLGGVRQLFLVLRETILIEKNARTGGKLICSSRSKQQSIRSSINVTSPWAPLWLFCFGLARFRGCSQKQSASFSVVFSTIFLYLRFFALLACSRFEMLGDAERKASSQQTS